MTYRDRIQQGSFRNVPFYTDTHNYEGGRHSIVHEFPERDDPFTEDMGRKARRFNLDIHIIGSDYFGLRNRMIRALEKGNDGILIHPYLGRKIVNVLDFTESESNIEGAFCVFSVTFVEHGKPINPTGTFGQIFAVFDQINSTIDSLQAEFESIYELALLPGYVADSALGVFNNITDTFTEAIGIVPATVSVVDQIKNNILDYGNSLSSTFNDAADIFVNTVTLQKSLTKITNDAKDKQTIQEYILDFGDDAEEPPILTESREKEQQNNQAIYRFVQGVAVTQIVSWLVQSVTEPFDVTVDEYNNVENNTIYSIGDLQDRRDEVSAIIDTYLDKFGNFESRQEFLNLKALMINALPQVETVHDLKREKSITPKSSLPSLVLVYDQHETIDSEDDFLKRNKIQNPAFVPGGTTYEIVETG